MLRLVVRSSVRAAVQSVIDDLSEPERDRAQGIELLDTGSGQVTSADGVLLQGLDAGAVLELLDRAPQVRWLHSPGAGVEGWPLEEIAARGVTLTNAAGVYAIPIAEWVLATMLQIAKRLRDVADAQRERRWLTDLAADELFGKTLLVLGSGGIAQQVISRAAAFGLRILVANRSGRPVDLAEQTVSGDAWRDLLSEADYLVSTLPLTRDTRSMISTQEIAQLNPGAWVINVGRGGTVDEEALFAALADHRIGGAALDVFTTEPLSAESPAWDLDNLIVSPHVSGFSPVSQQRGLELFVDNALRLSADEPLTNVVDLSAGY